MLVLNKLRKYMQKIYIKHHNHRTKDVFDIEDTDDGTIPVTYQLLLNNISIFRLYKGNHILSINFYMVNIEIENLNLANLDNVVTFSVNECCDNDNIEVNLSLTMYVNKITKRIRNINFNYNKNINSTNIFLST